MFLGIQIDLIKVGQGDNNIPDREGKTSTKKNTLVFLSLLLLSYWAVILNNLIYLIKR